MIQIKFKNLDKSELAQEAVLDRVGGVIEKFEDLKESRTVVTLEMENSPHQAGPDFFTVKVHISRGRFDGTTITKSDSNLYRALADVADHLLEVFNRLGDRDRVKKRKRARQLKIATLNKINLNEQIESEGR